MDPRRRLERAAAARQSNQDIIAACDGKPEPAIAEGFPANFPPPTPWSEALFAANLDLANISANRWAAKCPLPLEDLESITRQGLLRGCRKYDPHRINPHTGEPYALASAVCPFIEGEVLHWFRDSKTYAVKFPSRWRKAWGKVQKLLSEPGSTYATIAAATGLTAGEVQELAAAMVSVIPFEDLTVEVPTMDLPIDMVPTIRKLVDLSTDAISFRDQAALLSWWEGGRRRDLPAQAFERTVRAWRQLVAGKRIAQYVQEELALGVPSVVAVTKERRPKGQRRQREHVVTLSLLDLAG
jgi:hypothetical protein